MQANKLDGLPSNWFLTLMICLQCSDNDFGGGDVPQDVLYGPGGKVDLISKVFSRFGSQSCLFCKIVTLIFALKSSIE